MITGALWVVGRVHNDPVVPNEPVVWSMMGVFDSPKEAAAGCRSPSDFVGPMMLNVLLPEEAEYRPGIYFPLKEKADV